MFLDAMRLAKCEPSAALVFGQFSSGTTGIFKDGGRVICLLETGCDDVIDEEAMR